MTEVTYKQGATEVWCDGEKIIVTNPNGRQYIKDNVERIFGMGEYDKIYAVKYYDNTKRNHLNPMTETIEICSSYIPARVKKDLIAKGLPGETEQDYTKFFERKE